MLCKCISSVDVTPNMAYHNQFKVGRVYKVHCIKNGMTYIYNDTSFSLPFGVSMRLYFKILKPREFNAV